MTGPDPNTYAHILLTDPSIIGVVTWIGFAATVVGLTIAIWQIGLAKSAADAATDAVIALGRIVHSRERLLDLTTALRLLDSARHHIAQRDFSKAVIFLEFARNECVQVRELNTGNAHSGLKIGNILIRVTRLIEEITISEADGLQDDTAVKHGLEARSIGDELSAMLAHLRYRYSENEMNNDHTR